MPNLPVLLLIVLAVACDADRNPPAPVGGADEDPSPPPTYCDAYLGCSDLCNDDACVEACAEVTEAPVDECEQSRCALLLGECENGDADACAILPRCGGYTETSSTSNDENTGSEGVT